MTSHEEKSAFMKKHLLGTWNLESWKREIVDTGEKSDAFGPDPKGFINYSPDWRIMVVLVRGDRPQPMKPLPSLQEKAALFDSFMAYGGTYVVHHDRVIHHVDISWNQSWTGTFQTRFHRLDGEKLILSSAPAPAIDDGRECIYTVTWNRIKPASA